MGKKWKVTTGITAVTVATLALAACSSSGGGSGDSGASGDNSGASGTSGSAASSTASGSGVRIGVVIKGLDNPYFQAMEQGIKEQAKADGVSVEIQAAQSTDDTTGQADKLATLANQNFDCYLINPITGTNLIQGIAQISGSGKPIVNIDSPVDADAAKQANAKLATYAGTNNVDAGKLAGQQMATLLPDGGTVAVIGGTAGDVTSGDRVNGFKQGIDGHSITVAQEVAANWSRPEAVTQAQTVLLAHPDLSGFFVANDDMALGVAQAVSAAGKSGKVKIVSVDGIQDALKNIQSGGGLSALVSQYPYVAGAEGVEACEAAAAGKTLPESVAAPVALVTSDNVADALSAFPKPFDSYDDPYATLLGK